MNYVLTKTSMTQIYLSYFSFFLITQLGGGNLGWVGTLTEAECGVHK